jgi:signal transduction histidine kinase
MSSNGDSASAALAKVDLEKRVEERFGVLPNFFRLTPETPEITEKLWGFATAAYLDNPLPSLFKERLFVHLSRFCAVRYCIARHVGFLTGLGCPAGDPLAPVHTVEDVVRLLRREVPRGEELELSLSVCAKCPAPLAEVPSADSQIEDAVFALATQVFLQTGDAAICLDSLLRLFGEVRFQYLLLLMAFVRAAHYWTKTHPELKFEDDIQNLLATQEVLAACILNDPEAKSDAISQLLLDELPSLRRRNAEILQQSEELRDLSRRLLEAQDQERRRIARELHDSAGQTLTVLGMKIAELSRNAQQDPSKLSKDVEDTRELIESLSREIRTASYLLHPPLLDESGLSSALHLYLQGAMERSGIEIDLQIPEGFGRLPTEMELVVFRIVQECLTNIHRHSGSNIAFIRVLRDAEKVYVEVEDRGKGIPPERLSEIQSHGEGVGVGIRGMRERVRHFGGAMDIQSKGRGTKISFVLSVPHHCALSA